MSESRSDALQRHFFALYGMHFGNFTDDLADKLVRAEWNDELFRTLKESELRPLFAKVKELKPKGYDDKFPWKPKVGHFAKALRAHRYPKQKLPPKVDRGGVEWGEKQMRTPLYDFSGTKPRLCRTAFFEELPAENRASINTLRGRLREGTIRQGEALHKIGVLMEPAWSDYAPSEQKALLERWGLNKPAKQEPEELVKSDMIVDTEEEIPF